MRNFGVLTSVFVICAAPILAQTVDSAPLSAIDWLSESVEQPRTARPAPDTGSQAIRIPDAGEAPVANSATTPRVSVQALGGPAPRALGLLAPEVTGFPVDIWENSDPDTLIALLTAQEVDTLPAVQNLLVALALTQTNPPLRDANRDAFFRARVDKLLDFGALETAQAMLEAAVPDTADLFRRWFDVSLLTGTEDHACRELRARPNVAPTPSARIFCLARSGDWSAAVLTLNTGLALGDIDAPTGDLLSRFLDPELFEGEPDLAPPDRVTPLTFRMFEAIGAPLSTQGLARAFSHADLRPNVGWKAQLEAAERLARAGAISDNALIGIYTSRVPTVSGGVWERAKAVMQMDAALASGDDLEAAIDRLWDEATQVGVIVPLAQTYAERLIEIEDGTAIVFKMLLLSDLYETAALDPDLARTDPFLAQVAQGRKPQQPARTANRRTLVAAFDASPDSALVAMATDGRTGEAILRAIATVQQGIDGDTVAFGEGFATLRALGLEDAARRIALQYLVLQ